MMETKQTHSDQFDSNMDAVMEMKKELSAAGVFSLGYWLQSVNKIEEASECYKQVIREAPECIEAYYNLGVLHYQQARLSRAVDYFKKALSIKPDLAEALSSIGMIWCEQGRYDEAMACLKQALTVNPKLAQGHYHMGLALQNSGRYQQGRQSYQRAMACNPDFAPARWLHSLSLPMIYDTVEQITEHRKQFALNLAELVNSIDLQAPDQKQYALEGINTCTNFYLQYQGKNDLDLQIQYGGFVNQVMAVNFPQWASPKPMLPLRTGAKIRIGYVSSFMFSHTIGVFLSGWLENHNKNEFEIHCYHMGVKVDALTKHLQAHSHAFSHFGGNVEMAARQIEADQLHILVHTDIGMNPETQQLAALRLAPVQCKGWGHPVTTGLPTMDYYLSSDLMEPENADPFYSEKLIRLPNLALCYAKPHLPQKPKPRQQLNLPKKRFIFLSTQSLFKYLPQHDDIYPRIAKKVAGAYFVFIGNQSPAATERFRQRLNVAFQKHDLTADEFCQILPRLTGEDFLSLNLAADVLLDTLEWSGGKTTLEAISCGLPVVTCPGQFMRGRHAYAMLKRIGLTATIAQDKTAYCDIASRLANEPYFLGEVKKTLHDQQHRLYGDQVFINGLENFYKSVVQRHPESGAPEK